LLWPKGGKRQSEEALGKKINFHIIRWLSEMNLYKFIVKRSMTQ
jgi:hypothetical protein